MPRLMALIVLFALTGRAAADDRYARLKPFIGRTMADFMRTTGLTPHDSYEIAGGRVFVVHGPAFGVVVAPGVVASGGCRMQIEARAVGTRSAADAWQITAIDAHGPC